LALNDDKKYIDYIRKGVSKVEAKKNILTFAGLKALEDELFELKVNKRKEVAQKIKEAREQGDLSENAEYDAAKDEQRDIEARIEEIEKILKNVEVVDEDEVDLDTISIGCRVRLYDVDMEEEVEYRIVGSTEADSLNFKISNEYLFLVLSFPDLTLLHTLCQSIHVQAQMLVCQYSYIFLISFPD